MVSRVGWALASLAAVSFAALGPDARGLLTDFGRASFPDTLLAIGSLVQLGLSTWVLAVVALTLVRTPAPILRRVAPHLFRRALLAGTAGALAVAPASADRASAPDEAPARDIVGLRVPDRPTIEPLPARVAEPIVVRAGDTLWAIAAGTLPDDAATADVARACARWYAVNRDVIGADPNLIFPAQHLIPPAGKDHT
ncbi:hypothetical protein C6I20_11270 [Aeromicrobium sp. A1-2]|uniref:LysM peptidoglycan-binding domain-containing protein n=1 Tax=Aeromicrobium sp. A1-2 TaxID=2107713 RepID=UPI000E501C28|nr:LysM domain-containing protein [Aeromicrobium sp. A1-2]AXT85711.1 hypothetical protein C6I20_11270 [Aeromicrobium sp. A1-2]